MDAPWARIVGFFNGLQPKDLARLGDFYAAQAEFKDPFNAVRGLSAVEGIYGHMFKALEDPRFTVVKVLPGAGEAFLTWDFDFGLKGRPAQRLRIHGATHLVLDAQGLITLHRDYWDAAEELYEKLPVLGSLMRWLKRRAKS